MYPEAVVGVKLFPGICNGCRHLWHSGGDWLFSSVHTRWCLDHSCSTLCWCRLSFWVRIRHKIRRHCAISLKIRKKKQMNERLDCCNCLINALAFLNYLTKWWKVPLCLVCFAFAFLCFETCEGGFHSFFCHYFTTNRAKLINHTDSESLESQLSLPRFKSITRLIFVAVWSSDYSAPEILW